jgi:hypothetical protein
MPSTYSINDNTTTNAISSTDINYILSKLPDNTQKLISPSDVRDAIYSLWENSIIRETSLTGTGSYYIGIAQSDIKEKILIGKKELSGQNILNTSLLSNDTDIYFYNTKLDADPSQDTKISILAGTGSIESPYFKSAVVSGTTSRLSLEVVNPSGDINILSKTDSRVSINNILFPSPLELSGTASNGKMFVYQGSYPNGKIVFGDTTISLNTIGVTGSTTSIYGTPILLNGYPLEFTDNNPIMATIGGIVPGMTFSKVPFDTLLREILYPYLSPACSISIIGSNVREVDNSALPFTINVSFTIVKKTATITTPAYFTPLSPGFIITSGPTYPISGIGQITNNGLGYWSYNSYPNEPYTATMSISVTDGTYSSSDTKIVDYVLPYFYGFSSNGTPSVPNVSGIVNSLNKDVSLKSDKSYPIFGNGYLYFAYPFIHGTISHILDPNGFSYPIAGTMSPSFTYSVWTVSNSKWSASYYVYKSVNTTSWNPPSDNFVFQY